MEKFWRYPASCAGTSPLLAQRAREKWGTRFGRELLETLRLRMGDLRIDAFAVWA